MICVKHLARLTAGGTPTTGDESLWGADGEGVPWVAIGDMSAGGSITAGSRWVNRAGLRAARLTVGKPGTVLFAMYASVGAVATLGVPAVWNQAIIGLTPRSTDTDSRFLAYWMRHLSTDVRSLARTSTQDNLNADQVANLPGFDVPPDEQRRIADFLDDQVGRMDKAANLRASQLGGIQANLLRCAHSAVTGSTCTDRVPSGVPWADTLPSTWPVAKLSLVARLGTGHTPSRSEPEYWLNCSIPWVTTSDVKRFRSDEIETIHDTAVQISDLGLRNSAAVMHRAGTVALCRTSGSAGYSIVMGKDMATSQDMATWTCGPSLDPYFLLWVLRASRVDLLDRLGMGSTHKTIYFPDLEMLRIPLPPLVEQRTAVEFIRARAALLRELRRACVQSLASMEERKRTLITACVTGEFDVSAASDRAGDAALQGVAG